MNVSKITTHISVEGLLRASCWLEDISGRTTEIFIEAEGLPVAYAPTSANWAAMIGFFPAMMADGVLHIDGEVDRDLLVNLAELNAIWHRWEPDIYKPLRISSSAVETRPRPDFENGGWLLAFSGGVDAMATLIRHSDDRLGWRRREIGGAFFVQGFDIPLHDDKAFERAFANAAKAIRDTGIPLHKVRTNLRETGCNWEHVFGLSLVAVASLYGLSYKGLLMGSGSNHYLNHMVCWGSSPIVDPLHGCVRFQQYTDGCEQSRSDKIRLLAENGAPLEYLRVCWQMESHGVNCGICEKCIRTKLTFLANGHEPPGCLGSPLEPSHIRALKLRNKPQSYNFREIMELAERNQISDWWVGEVRTLIKKTECSSSSSLLNKIKRKIKKLTTHDK